MTESLTTEANPGHEEARTGRAGSSLPGSFLRVVVTTSMLVAVVLVLVMPLPNPWRATWRCKVLDIGHIPLFALVTVAIHRSLGTGLVITGCVAMTMAGACELLQAMVHRSADWSDFLRGVIGSMLAIVVVNCLKRPRRVAAIATHSGLAGLLLIWPLMDATPKLWDAWSAYRSFPIICEFETRWAAHRWAKDNATVERVPSSDSHDNWVGRIEFFPNERDSSGVILFPVCRDWSQYRQLCCDFSLAQDAPELLISVRDGRKVSGPRKRFDLVRGYASGEHELRIDLAALARGGEFAPLDLTRVQSFHLVLLHPKAPCTLYLRSVRLE